jgi:hypothetical protein
MSWARTLTELNAENRVAVLHGEPLPPPKPCPHCWNRTARGWHQRKGPDPVLRDRHGLDRCQRLPDWVDHSYRLRLEDGRWCYVAEPYLLYDEAIDDLAYLRGHGFDVTVNAEVARHLPGRTIAVLIAQTLPAGRS